MKKILLSVVLTAFIALFVLFEVGAGNVAHDRFYPVSGTVVILDENSDIVHFQDNSGRLWNFYGVEDWQIGDSIAAIMDSMDSDEVKDDRVVKVRYCGQF